MRRQMLVVALLLLLFVLNAQGQDNFFDPPVVQVDQANWLPTTSPEGFDVTCFYVTGHGRNYVCIPNEYKTPTE